MIISENVPHGELIVPNGSIVLESIFQFTGGAEELFPFLHACKQLNCSVSFHNEGLTVFPTDDWKKNIVLTFYASLAGNEKIRKEYIQYLRRLMAGEYNSNVSLLRTDGE